MGAYADSLITYSPSSTFYAGPSPCLVRSMQMGGLIFTAQLTRG